MESSNGLGQAEATTSAGIDSASIGQTASNNAASERVFKQSEVNDIVKRAKHGAVEDYRRLSSEQPDYAARKYGDVSQQHPSNSQVSQSTLPETDIRRVAAEEAQRLRDTWIKDEQSKADNANAQRTVQNFWNKISPGREKYSDFDQVVSSIEIKAFPNVVHLLGDFVDNSADVLYELGNDRIKLAQLEMLAERSPRDAVIQAQRLSQSLKDNETAKKVTLPREPLSQLRPSNTGTDSGVMGWSDLKRKYRG